MTGENITRNAPLSSVQYRNLPRYGAAIVDARGYAHGEEYMLSLWFYIDASGVPTIRSGTLENDRTRSFPQPPYGDRWMLMTCSPYYG